MFYLYFAMSIKFPLTQRAHLISANHRMERFSKNDPWVIFNMTTSSSMTFSGGNRHSFRICLANERHFHIKSFSGKRFSTVHISLRGSIFPITGFSFSKWGSFNTRRDLSFPKWLEIALIKVNLYPLRSRLQNIALLFNFEAPFEIFHLTGLTLTSKAGAY